MLGNNFCSVLERQNANYYRVMRSKFDGDWTRLLILGAIVHAIFIYSIFDIYYTSPIVTNARPHLLRRGESPLAKRLVFLSAGLQLLLT